MIGYLRLTAHNINLWRKRRGTIRKLSSLSDHTLNDIGVSRHQIDPLVDSICRTEGEIWLRTYSQRAERREVVNTTSLFAPWRHE